MPTEKPISIDFREPANLGELARYIGVDETYLANRLQKFHEETFFFRHEIPKRSSRLGNEVRVVWEAHPFMADAYKAFGRRFELFARYVEPRFPHNASYGYVRGRGTIDNAKGHCATPLILHADIENFFPTINREKLKRLFMTLDIQEETADLLSAFTTIQDTLPLGLHASPLLANLVCLDLDDKLEGLAKKYDCFYTRYADDITISGNILPDKLEIMHILEEEGFRLSERKFRITKPGQAHYVTGLSVTDFRPRAPKKMKRRLRQELYYCKKFGIKEHIDRIDLESN